MKNRSEFFCSVISIVLLAVLFLQGCSFGRSDDASYFKVFDHIKTDQFNWSYGHGGIYWVSENHVVLDAQIKNKQGIPERGLYQVNVENGSHIKLVEIGDVEEYRYCFDGETLYVRNKTGNLNVLYKSSRFSISVEVLEFNRERHRYGEARCKFFKKPADDGGYLDLKEQDGYIKNKYRENKNDKTFIYLINNNGEEQKQLMTLPPKSNGFSGSTHYLPDRDAYFGASSNHGCANMWWLYRENWSAVSKKVCFGPWSKRDSNIVLSTKVGLFVENHRIRKPRSYLISGEKEYKIVGGVRGSSVAPDGCRVAYGSGSYRSRNGTKDYRQVLKIIDTCKFIESRNKNESKGEKI